MQKNDMYEKLSNERKKLQMEDKLPEWMTTMGWQTLKNKDYLYKTNDLKYTFRRMAKTAARHLNKLGIERKEYYQRRFFEIMWYAHMGPSTPNFNLGTPKGCPISCAGNVIGDSVLEFYEATLEAAMLTKECFGTSSYLGEIRHRGAPISRGGTAQGILPVFNDNAQVMIDITQGTARRGNWAGYIDLMCPDFDEVIDDIFKSPEGKNIGINYYDDDLIAISNQNPEAIRRYQKHMKLRAVFGKGYFYFPDRVARMQPKMYAELGLRSKASNLCSEITLHADSEHTYTCVLSSMNLAKYDEWKDTDAVQVATIFLDCVVSEFLDIIENKPANERRVFQKVINSTKKSRALGLGVMGFHTLLREKMIPVESEECVDLNEEIFKHIHDESLKASQFLAKELGEPEWCKGHGVRNTHRTSLPPTMSSSVVCMSVSQSIEWETANTYQQKLAGGTVYRVNPTLMKIMKERGKLTEEEIERIGIELDGSVQTLDYLTDLEKEVFKTADEIDPKVTIDLAAARQKWICQAQSLNLQFKADESEEYISDVHLYAMFNPNIKSLYYMRSKPTSKASSGKSVTTDECLSCHA